MERAYHQSHLLFKSRKDTVSLVPSRAHERENEERRWIFGSDPPLPSHHIYEGRVKKKVSAEKDETGKRRRSRGRKKSRTSRTVHKRFIGVQICILNMRWMHSLVAIWRKRVGEDELLIAYKLFAKKKKNLPRSKWATCRFHIHNSQKTKKTWFPLGWTSLSTICSREHEVSQCQWKIESAVDPVLVKTSMGSWDMREEEVSNSSTQWEEYWILRVPVAPYTQSNELYSLFLLFACSTLPMHPQELVFALLFSTMALQ